MSVTNSGNQTITFKYGHSTTSEEFNKKFCKVIKPGIYEGGTLTITSDVIYIAAFVAMVRTSTGQIIKIETSANVESDLNGATPLIPVTEIAPYLVANYTWINATNYLDFSAKALGDIYSNDIVFGKALFSVGSVIGFDYADKTYGLIDQSNNLYAEHGNFATLSVNDTTSGIVDAISISKELEIGIGSGSASIYGASSGTITNTGFLKMYSGLTPIYIPYFIDITG